MLHLNSKKKKLILAALLLLFCFSLGSILHVSGDEDHGLLLNFPPTIATDPVAFVVAITPVIFVMFSFF